MGEPAVKIEKRFTYKDYLNWPDEEHWEIINGIAYDMSPAPGTYHQEISIELTRQISNYLKGKTCRVFAAPFDVRLPDHKNESDNDIDNVVQPDIVVICDQSKIDERGCNGPPDWVIEILSPYTAKKDMSEKYSLYENYGVKEYWIVDPGSKCIHVYHVNENKQYELVKIFFEKDKIESKILKGLNIELESIFRK